MRNHATAGRQLAARSALASIHLAAIALAIAACRPHPPTPESAALAPQQLIIDVRTPQEFAADHIAGAINIPHDQIGARIAQVAPAKDREIVLYCRSGRRAGRARDTLDGMGYTNITNAGGIEELREKLKQ